MCVCVCVCVCVFVRACEAEEGQEEGVTYVEECCKLRTLNDGEGGLLCKCKLEFEQRSRWMMTYSSRNGALGKR
ncbi:hypothetical protein B0I35DRAFT_188365 [Stachybotrys elegans]|uniref:Secreted protein n=1 Tax=Stachybotrys elegans TaxID=80388 RepID=A0A8K0SXB1_9HYPO|nr:hypothetical protein B0I35DRAFT_188365 [Stachybotrys elegans]